MMASLRNLYLANQTRVAAYLCVLIILAGATFGFMYLIAYWLPPLH